MARDFTFDVWRDICTAFTDTGFVPLSVHEYLLKRNSGNLPDKFVILRHDIDRRTGHALDMAQLEQELGIHSTYYFRVPYTFHEDVIRQISSMGHEIGFHYETLSKAKGDVQKARSFFEKELAMLRTCGDVDTICMHGRPLSSYDNRELWRSCDFQEYDILGEAYLSVSDVCYFTDTGRSWGSTNSMRDSLLGAIDHAVVQSSDEFLQWISETDQKRVYVTSHPERWAGSFGDWVVCFGMDNLMGIGKRILRTVR